MPIYEYRCTNGHTFEVLQRMTDPPVERCEVCGATVERVFHPVAVHFKGSGFYNTDYGKKRRGQDRDASSDTDSSKKSESSTSSDKGSSSDSGSSSGEKQSVSSSGDS